jgi:hypothetical protein
MKKLALILLTIALVVSSSTAFAQEKAALGISNLALKIDYINFTESELKHADVDTGLYLGLEGYTQILPALYLGLEAGYANPDGHVELTYIPVELNLKYALPASPNFVMDFGGGASYNYAKFKNGDSEDDWLFGGQLFIDANYTSGGFFVGINGKYQLTEKFSDSSISLNNWRVGGQVGLMF